MGVQLNATGKFLLALIGIALIGFAIYRLGFGDTTTKENTEKREDTSAKKSERKEIRKNVLSAMRSGNVLRVGMESEAPPMNYFYEGKRQGFDYEMALLIAGKLGIARVDVVEDTYDKLPSLLQNGNIDLMMGGYVPDPEISNVDWSEGYLDFGLCLIVRQGSAIRELKHLQGKRVGIYEDVSVKKWVTENIPGVESIQSYKGTNWFKVLENGEVDAIIYDYPFTVREIRQFPKLRIVKLNLNTSQYAIGLPSNNDDLLTAVNSAIKEIITSPDYERIVKKYLSSDAVQVAELPKGSKIYVVKAGDSLSGIAQKQLGNKDQWKTLYELNKNRLANPHLLSVGMQLLMP